MSFAVCVLGLAVCPGAGQLWVGMIVLSSGVASHWDFSQPFDVGFPTPTLSFTLRSEVLYSPVWVCGSMESSGSAQSSDTLL